MIQLSILSDAGLFRDVLATRLAAEGQFQLVSVARTIYDLLVRAQARPIQILLVHLGVEPAVGAEVVRSIHILLPATRVVVLGSQGDDAETVRWVEAGAMACLAADASWACLLETIRSVAEGRVTYSPEVVGCMAHRIGELERAWGGVKPTTLEPLSDRELEVAQLISLGFLQKHVARRLNVNGSTVKTHVGNVFRKLHVKRRRDLI